MLGMRSSLRLEVSGQPQHGVGDKIMKKVCYIVLAIPFLVGCQERTTVKVEALKTILPMQSEINAHLPGVVLSREDNRVSATFQKSPDFLGGREQKWLSRDKSSELEVMVSVFGSREAAVWASEKSKIWSSVPWHKVWKNPIGENCRFAPHSGWSIEFIKSNVYVQVQTRPGDEPLARAVARVIESKIEAMPKG